MLTVRQAAQRAGVCASLVYEWIASKVLAHFRLGKCGTRGKIAIAEADLDAFLEARKVGAERPKAAPVPKPRPIRLKHLRIQPS